MNKVHTQLCYTMHGDVISVPIRAIHVPNACEGLEYTVIRVFWDGGDY